MNSLICLKWKHVWKLFQVGTVNWYWSCERCEVKKPAQVNDGMRYPR